MVNRTFKLVVTSGIAKSHNIAVIFREQIGLHWLTGIQSAIFSVRIVPSLTPHELEYTAAVDLSQLRNPVWLDRLTADALLYQLDIPHLSGIATPQLTSDYTGIPTTTVLITGSKIIE